MKTIVDLSTGSKTTVEFTTQEETQRLQKHQEYLDSITYAEKRARAYPSIADQLDQIYHEGIDAWKETIAAVKAEYPKP